MFIMLIFLFTVVIEKLAPETSTLYIETRNPNECKNFTFFLTIVYYTLSPLPLAI